MAENQFPERAPWRNTMHEVIFGVDTYWGRRFDVLLMWCIVLSVVAVMLDSVSPIRAEYGTLLYTVEWIFTVLFTMEYVARLLCAQSAVRYSRSFYGAVDLLSIVPTYLGLFAPGGAQSLIVIRALRLLRIFRVLKLVHFVQDANLILGALASSRRKITAFLGAVLIIALIAGTAMYLIEGRGLREDGTANGFSSIPRGMYWAIVTVTTVGYGDISPKTPLGQFVSAILMIAGYSILAVPTGIVSVELAQATSASQKARTCPSCLLAGHDLDAVYCKFCGHEMAAGPPDAGGESPS